MTEANMRIIPIKELKDGAKVSEMCHESDEAIHITKNGYADMVIMSTSAFEDLLRDAQANRAVSLIQEGIQAIRQGECKDAFEALSTVRAKYGV